MGLFKTLIELLTVGSLGLAAVQIYLTVNKIWKRKHERAVAESISIMGETLGLVPLVVLTTNFMLAGQWAGVVDGAMWILAGGVTVTIGTGWWVEGRRGLGLWTLLKDALKLERGEVGDLAKSLFRPTAARKILAILGQVALIDEHLDDREREYIQSFAESWGIKFSFDELLADRAGGHINFINLRRDASDYLATSPPPAQVKQLGDVLNSLVTIDEEVSAEEELVLAELNGMLNSYLNRDLDVPVYGIAVVPQDGKQDEAIAALLPNVVKRDILGGQAYVTGRYYSPSYAEVICGEYRALSFFATVVNRDHGAL